MRRAASRGDMSAAPTGPSPHRPLTRKIKLTVVAADELIKREVFALPDPFAAVHIFRPNAPYAPPVASFASPIARASLNPYWAADFEFEAEEGTRILVRIHDNSKYKRKHQGFLGEVTISSVGEVLASNRVGQVSITRDLEKSADNLAVSGKVILQLSADQLPRLAAPPPQPVPVPQPVSAGARYASPYADNGPRSPGHPNGPYPPSAHRPSNSNLSPQSAPAAPSRQQYPPQPATGARLPPSSIRRTFASTRRQDGQEPQQLRPVGERDRTGGLHRQMTIAQHRAGAANVRAVDEVMGAVAMDEQALTGSMGRLSVNGAPDRTRATSPSGRRPITVASLASTPVPAPQVDRRPLPEGWELKFAPNGKAYFVDHNNRRTTWEDPRGPPPRGTVAPGAAQRPTSSSSVSSASRPSTAPAAGASTGGRIGESTAAAADGSTRPAAARTSSARSSTTVPDLTVSDDALGPLPSGWEVRKTASGKPYWVDHNTKTTTWEDPRMPSMDPNTDQSKRDFRRKLIYFRSQPAQRPAPGDCRIVVRRDNLFEDAFSEVMKHSEEDLRKRLMITFKGEEGVDFGGVSREFFFLLSHAIFDPSFCLFEHTEKGNYTLQFNPNSSINPEHLDYFQFVGRAVGLAIYHRRFLDAHFATSIYKLALGRPVGLEDMAMIDADMHQSLTWMKDNDITDVLYEDFVDEHESFGVTQKVELKPDGANIPVTEENKLEYIKLLCEHRLKGRVEQQVNAFNKGLHEIVKADALSIFDERELELLIGGLSDIDVDDWQKYTEYRGYVAEDEVVQWFWQTVKSWNSEKRSRLLQFSTGTSRTPVNGFRDLQGSDGPRKFTIEKVPGNLNSLPKTHTCFNRIDLPPYPSLEILETKLTYAMEETQGFGDE
ncbi:hypothetical protein BCR35DRAFT_293021 [Leucosporidium creatinivorum]|uniref:E3 ubiquitin-protein ligase n=1 Tax=Leucosporidium creatinivorum TaxID=106004 RepID=A0A1Y2EUV5_9BASI|nr:hypothetical protein BCR35DRAFT_293021 [Leucosporidium creatinivorum]